MKEKYILFFFYPILKISLQSNRYYYWISFLLCCCWSLLTALQPTLLWCLLVPPLPTLLPRYGMIVCSSGPPFMTCWRVHIHTLKSFLTLPALVCLIFLKIYFHYIYFCTCVPWFHFLRLNKMKLCTVYHILFSHLFVDGHWTLAPFLSLSDQCSS